MRLCVHWPRLGPYHLARLRAVHARCAREGADLIALETAAQDATYAWDLEADALPFRRVCAFPGTAFEAVAPRDMMDGVARQLDALVPDAVAITSYSTPDAQACVRWCRQHRRTAVLMFDSRAEDAERSGWREAIKRQLVRQFDAALVAGTPQRAYAEALGVPADLVFTPYDVVDNAFFARAAEAARRPAGVPADRPFFLTSGRFIARKNLRTLLDAYAVYRARGGSWGLVLLGDGPLRPPLEDRAAALGAPDVHFLGFRQFDALPAFYAAASAYVHPAQTDQWGLVVNEAMACGLPVLVSTGTGCALDLVRDNGRTFAPDRPDTLAEALAWMASRSDAERAAMGRKSRAIIASFRPEDFADGLWAAVHAGAARADRPLGLRARLVLGALRRVARSATDFHSVPA